jgi:hypothetical protein
MAGSLVLPDEGVELASIWFPLTGILFGQSCFQVVTEVYGVCQQSLPAARRTWDHATSDIQVYHPASVSRGKRLRGRSNAVQTVEALQLEARGKVKLAVTALWVGEKHLWRQTRGLDGSIKDVRVDDSHSMTTAIQPTVAAFLEELLETFGVLIVSFALILQHLDLYARRASGLGGFLCCERALPVAKVLAAHFRRD